MELFAAFGIASVVWYGGSSVIAGTRTPGDFFAFMTAMFLMYQPFKNLTRTYTMLHQGLAGAERVFEIVDEKPSIANKPGARNAAPFGRVIEFEDVCFSYGAEPVLQSTST
jgi:subfamily B ATP-binding cassette protein MsbA